jgi:catechol 2,3-dioxygenase-like lactoylglutathione lyase family enzyme
VTGSDPFGVGATQLVAFVGAVDLGRARRFYEGVLGLEVVEETAYALVFDVGGANLRVTRVERVVAAPYTVLGWTVRDVDAAVRELGARGVAAVLYDGLEQDELGIWRAAGGARVAWLRDPDGNLLSVTQR